jgi:DNA polymerase-3 subunit alpha
MVFPQILDSVNSKKKNDIEGQMSLFDFASEEQKEDLKISMPVIDEFDKEMLLAFEKELMGVYVSGHPLDDYIQLLEKNITAKASEFLVDEESGQALVKDNSEVIVGGMISGVTTKYTRNGKAMAFINLEDLTGTMEIIVFPNSYEGARNQIAEGNKVFVKGRVQVEEEKDAKLIAQDIKGFDECKSRIWIQLESKKVYDEIQQKLADVIRELDGNDTLVIYLREEKEIQVMPPNWCIAASKENLAILQDVFGEENVKIVVGKVEFPKKSRRW